MSTHISIPPQLLLERILTLEIVRVTERAAVSAARLRGHGNEKHRDGRYNLVHHGSYSRPRECRR